jgi:hypothetical protein
MAIMHRSTPYGHLLVNGNALTDAQLGVLAGAPPDQITDLLRELESAGVFSRTRAGVIYSRRMTRDEKKARAAQKNGKNGGNPNLCKTTDILPSDKGIDNTPLKAQKPEARFKSPQTPTENQGRSNPARRVALAFGQLRMEHWGDEAITPTSLTTLEAEAAAYLANGHTEGQIIESLSRCMAAERRRGGQCPSSLSKFKKSLPEQLAKPQPGGICATDFRKHNGASLATWRLRLESFKTSPKTWINGNGDPPGHPDCLAPPDMLVEVLGPDYAPKVTA